MVQLVHDQSRVDPLQACMIPSGLSQAVSAEVAWHSNLFADKRDEFPSLPTPMLYPIAPV